MSATAEVDDVRNEHERCADAGGGSSKQLSNRTGVRRRFSVDSRVGSEQRAWSRRNTQSLVDGLYVELAKQLWAPLITTDGRLASSYPQAQVPEAQHVIALDQALRPQVAGVAAR